MRLRLTVRRNGIPEVKLMWNVDLSTDPTIYHLVANVNETVPLESGEWTLEDYAVEHVQKDGAGFEYLHFQSVRDVLKEDDRVLYASTRLITLTQLIRVHIWTRLFPWFSS
jgi:hypothetical protein